MQLPALYIQLYTHEHLLRLVIELQLKLPTFHSLKQQALANAFYFNMSFCFTSVSDGLVLRLSGDDGYCCINSYK